MTAHKKLTLRRRDGSLPHVIRVYAFDAEGGTALVLLRYPDGGEALDRVGEGELEAIYDDAAGTYGNVREVLIARCGHLLHR